MGILFKGLMHKLEVLLLIFAALVQIKFSKYSHYMSLIVITGPTASGKTDLAIHIAQKLGTEIVSADSRQVYRGMEIGSAQPNADQLEQVPHHFVACLDIDEPFSAGDFAEQSKVLLKKLFATHKHVVMVGGSGLYIKALLEGMNTFPDTDPNLRLALNKLYAEEGVGALQQLLKEKDPVHYEHVDIQNHQRLIRALEVCLSANKPFSYFQQLPKQIPDFASHIIVLDWPRDLLYQRINSRTDIMMEQGFLEEVRLLLPFAGLNPLNTIGYKEMFAHLRGELSLDEAVMQIKQHTRNFAKRQLTWIRNQFKPHWIKPGTLAEMTSEITQQTQINIPQ